MEAELNQEKIVINIPDNIDNEEYDADGNILRLSFNAKKKLIDKVKLLEESQREEIYKLIISDTDKYTEKADGIIVNLNNLSEACIIKIYNYITYSEDNIL